MSLCTVRLRPVKFLMMANQWLYIASCLSTQASGTAFQSTGSIFREWRMKTYCAFSHAPKLLAMTVCTKQLSRWRSPGNTGLPFSPSLRSRHSQIICCVPYESVRGVRSDACKVQPRVSNGSFFIVGSQISEPERRETSKDSIDFEDLCSKLHAPGEIARLLNIPLSVVAKLVAAILMVTPP